MADGEEEEEEEEEEERRRTKSIFLRFYFATSTKVSESLRVVLHLNNEGLLVPKLKTGLREHFRADVRIPNVQDAILNIGHSYLVNAVALTDKVIILLALLFRNKVTIILLALLFRNKVIVILLAIQ